MSEIIYTEQQRELVETQPIRRELTAERRHGIEIVVYWVKKSNLCLVALTDLDNNRSLEFAVEPDDIMDAVQHPFYYAARAGIEMPRDKDDAS